MVIDIASDLQGEVREQCQGVSATEGLQNGAVDEAAGTKSNNDEGLEANGGGNCPSKIETFKWSEPRILSSASEVEMLQSISDFTLVGRAKFCQVSQSFVLDGGGDDHGLNRKVSFLVFERIEFSMLKAR